MCGVELGLEEAGHPPGNMTNDTFHTYQYDAEGRVINVDGGTGNGGWTYNYNSRGLRNSVYFNNVNGPAEWLYNFDGSPETAVVSGTNTQSWSEYYAGHRHIATWQVAGSSYSTVFQLSDWLGTPRYMLNYAGAPFLECASLPFGEQTSSGNCQSYDGWQGISGLWFDTETDSVHTDARQLSLHQGRWLTPDPSGLAAVDFTKPQTWNRYSYVANNPISFTDPTGLDLIGPCDPVFGCNDGGGGDGGASCDFIEDPFCGGGGPVLLQVPLRGEAVRLRAAVVRPRAAVPRQVLRAPRGRRGSRNCPPSLLAWAICWD
jgi:RHS repeat-associated protein